jgi:hypothetical protein
MRIGIIRFSGVRLLQTKLVEMLGDRLLPIDAPLRTSCFKRMQTS